MKSTLEKRWIIKKYTGESLSYGNDLRPLVPDNYWLKIDGGNKNYISIKCPECHYFMDISIKKGTDGFRNHTVDDKGIIMPSVGHHCGFHEWCILEDY